MITALAKTGKAIIICWKIWESNWFYSKRNSGTIINEITVSSTRIRESLLKA